MAWRKIKRSGIRTAYIRSYPDTGQVLAHVEWSDGAWTSGDPNNFHMKELLKRFEREGGHVLRYGIAAELAAARRRGR